MTDESGQRRRLPGRRGATPQDQPSREHGATEETVEIGRLDPVRDSQTQAIPRVGGGEDTSRTGPQERHSLPRARPPQGAPSDEAVTHTGLRLPRPSQSAPLPSGHGSPGPRAQEPAGPQTSRLPASAIPSDSDPHGPATQPIGTHTSGLSEVDEQPGEEPRKRNPLLGLLRELTIVVTVALVISFLVKTFLAQPFWIPSGSMNNTLVRGDRVVVSKLTPGPFDLERGDVVVFEDPADWLPPPPGDRGLALRALEFVGLYPAGENHLIKRVIGLPGDRVKCCDAQNRLVVNGTPITEPYVYAGDAASEEKFEITVPRGRVWVMGDHRGNSSDSRFHDDGTGRTGSVPIDKVTGRAVLIVWPLGRMGWLSDYSTTFDKVAHP